MEQEYDIILVSGDYYIDHPLNACGVLKRVLEDFGFTVGIIEKPDWSTTSDFLKLGKPKLFFGISAGSIDSMLQNYTPLKKSRKEDKAHPFDSKIPDRAIIVYCNRIKELFKGVPIVIGGIEASLRRFAHYDYWDNKIRKSILLDSKADILVYGLGEYSIVEIAKRLKEKKALLGIESTTIVSKEIPPGFKQLPTFEEADKDKKIFCKMQTMFSNKDNIAQKSGDRYVLQYRAHEYTTKELDHIYDLPYSRNIPEQAEEFKMAQFSIVTHRGCIGKCNFCSIALHAGDKIVSRSEESILKEIHKLTKHDEFIGFIDDLGGPSANMYGMDCKERENCKKSCMGCSKLIKDHHRMIELLRKARRIKGVRKVFVRSGIRYDLALSSPEYIMELSLHHISGCLKIAPEHFSPKVGKLMNKNNDTFDKFKKEFDRWNRTLKQELKYYFMTAHPGCDDKENEILKEKIKELSNVESIQIFTPTPMSASTCMYHTAMNPWTLEKIHVPYEFSEKKKQKNMLFDRFSRFKQDKMPIGKKGFKRKNRSW